jgi:hypothetical protein
MTCSIFTSYYIAVSCRHEFVFLFLNSQVVHSPWYKHRRLGCGCRISQ